MDPAHQLFSPLVEECASGRKYGARRAELAAVYLDAFVAETLDLPESGEAVVDLRRWFVRINAAITMGAEDLDPELLEPDGDASDGLDTGLGG